MRLRSIFGIGALVASLLLALPASHAGAAGVSVLTAPSVEAFDYQLTALEQIHVEPSYQDLAVQAEVSPAATALNGANTSYGAKASKHKQLLASYLVNVDRLTTAPPQGVAAPVPIRS